MLENDQTTNQLLIKPYSKHLQPLLDDFLLPLLASWYREQVSLNSKVK